MKTLIFLSGAFAGLTLILVLVLGLLVIFTGEKYIGDDLAVKLFAGLFFAYVIFGFIALVLNLLNY